MCKQQALPGQRLPRASSARPQDHGIGDPDGHIRELICMEPLSEGVPQRARCVVVLLSSGCVVDYACTVEFRSSLRHEILVPSLVLFFGAIFLMAQPMFRLNRQPWLVTVATSVRSLGAMGAAMRKGVA
jgi:hypothetical protein